MTLKLLYGSIPLGREFSPLSVTILVHFHAFVCPQFWSPAFFKGSRPKIRFVIPWFLAQKMPIFELYLQNFLQTVKFMQCFGLDYSNNKKFKWKIKYTTRISCPCRFWNTPYLKWLLFKSSSGGLSKFAYIWFFLDFQQFCQSLLKMKKMSNVCKLWQATTRAF